MRQKQMTRLVWIVAALIVAACLIFATIQH
jgi:hypothetical protein